MTHRDLGSITELCDGISRMVVLYENKKIQTDMNKRFISFFFSKKIFYEIYHVIELTLILHVHLSY